jgi:flagellar basal-body rod protein FlgB
MRVDDIPLLAMLKGRLGYLGAREKIIAENVANADTPGYAPRDIKAPAFDQMVSAAMGGSGGGGGGMAASNGVAMTQSGHISSAGGRGPSGYKADKSPDSETRMDGNSVVLEEQMLKMAESRMAYDAAISFYQKSMNMLRMASRAPGR